MAIKIDNDLLKELGLGSLPEAEKNSLLKHIYETLEMRVGMRLADQMTNEQLDEFERYFEAKDDAGAFKWLETNFPNYKDIVQEEFEKLKVEVGQSAPQIVTASQQQQPAINPTPSASEQPAQQPYTPPTPPQPSYPQQPAPGYQPQAAPAPAQPYAAPQPNYDAPQPQSAQPAQPWQPQPPMPPQPTQQPPQYPQYPLQQPPAGPPQYPQQ